MDWLETAKEYFKFTRKDRIGILVLVCLIVSIFFLPQLFSPVNNARIQNADTAWITDVKKLELRTDSSHSRLRNTDSKPNRHSWHEETYDNKPAELFQFDPNTLDENGWKKLGLPNKTIAIILNYTRKGGKFRKPADLQRIYGLRQELFEKLQPYITISPQKSESFNYDPASRTPVNSWKSSTRTASSPVDINNADTTQLIALPGIGPRLATRIINFRDKLGGFYSIAQVGETFGLADSVFQKIKQYLKLENTTLRKININTATLEELKAHPYLRFQLARPIIAYREQHGDFSTIDDIRKVIAITEEIFNRLYPYLEVGHTP